MTTRCPHRNGVINEIATGVFSWELREGVIGAAGFRHEALTGGVEVVCWDCERTWVFGPRAKRPAWVEHLEAQIRERGMDPT